jgi:hypothetical protein
MPKQEAANYGSPAAAMMASRDQQLTQRIETARAAAKANPGGAKEAYVFAHEVSGAYQVGFVSAEKGNGPALLTESFGYLDAAASAHPEEAGKMLAAKGSLLLTSGDKAGGKQALEASFATPNLWPVAKLLVIYDEAGDKASIRKVCEKARAVTKTDEERYAVLDNCVHHAHASSTDDALAWAPKGDAAFYTQRRAEYDAQDAREARATREKIDADRKAMHDSFSKPGTTSTTSSSGSSSGGNMGSSSSGPVSVTIRSSCSKTVRVFYGNKPKFGSGTTSSISSNSVNSHSFRSGDMMWVVDDHDNGMGSVTVSPGTRELHIGSDCGSVSAR